MTIDRRDLLKLLGALGLGALGGVLATDIMHGLGERIIVQAALPGYSVMVQEPTGPGGESRPMVVSADGEVIVDSSGRIVSDLGVYPVEGINELGGYTKTAGIQEAIAYLLNTGGGKAF
ncbi:MAG: twin-arginine translocation signal domain-containing protein, partial [Vulcanisaeta sp.]|nr:twin-arginine translocation signal domain-containing protein [Vulcanisaeta sp.]